METTPYAFHYNDGSYIVYDITERDYEKVWDAMRAELPVVKISLGIFVTKDMRAIVEQKPVEDTTPAAEPHLTPEEQEWYAEHKAEWENFGKEEADK